MTLLHRLTSMLRWLVRRSTVERELHDELRTFIDMAAAAKEREGISPAEARRLATLDLGGVEQVKERVRSRRHGAWLDEVMQDLRYALRTLARAPVFTAVALLTLALGIGANTAIFTIVHGAILRPLAYPRPEQLISLTSEFPAYGSVSALSAAEYPGVPDPQPVFRGSRRLRDRRRRIHNDRGQFDCRRSPPACAVNLGRCASAPGTRCAAIARTPL